MMTKNSPLQMLLMPSGKTYPMVRHGCSASGYSARRTRRSLSTRLLQVLPWLLCLRNYLNMKKWVCPCPGRIRSTVHGPLRLAQRFRRTNLMKYKAPLLPSTRRTPCLLWEPSVPWCSFRPSQPSYLRKCSTAWFSPLWQFIYSW
eukprot:Rmarinus@m.21733